MRKIATFVVVAALLWSLWWLGAAFSIRQGLETWIAARQAEGWLAEHSGMESAGYPLRHVTRMAAPALADPETGAAWRAEALVLESPAIWPGEQRLEIEGPQRLSFFDETAVLRAEPFVADLRLAPGTALTVERLRLHAGPWSLAEDGGPLAAASGLELSAVQAEDAPASYALRLAAPDFMPGERLRRLAQAANGLPERFRALRAEARVTFDRPWDRRALEQARPQPVRLVIERAEAEWGELRLAAAGTLDIGEGGLPEGVLTLRAENWREMLAMARGSGALPPALADGAERTLAMLEGLGGTPGKLDLRLNFRGGYVALGPIPLGPAPRLILR